MIGMLGNDVFEQTALQLLHRICDHLDVTSFSWDEVQELCELYAEEWHTHSLSPEEIAMVRSELGQDAEEFLREDGNKQSGPIQFSRSHFDYLVRQGYIDFDDVSRAEEAWDDGEGCVDEDGGEKDLNVYSVSFRYLRGSVRCGRNTARPVRSRSVFDPRDKHLYPRRSANPWQATIQREIVL